MDSFSYAPYSKKGKLSAGGVAGVLGVFTATPSPNSRNSRTGYEKQTSLVSGEVKAMLKNLREY